MAFKQNSYKSSQNDNTGERSEWSRNFGVVTNDSSGTQLAQYIVTLERIDPSINVTDKNGKDTDKKKDATDLGMRSLSGLMTNSINYSLTANWDSSNNQVSSMIQKGFDVMLGGVTGFARLGGIEGTSAGYATRKVYKGGTEVSLSINLRLFDSTTNLTSSDTKGIDTRTSVMDGVAWINSVMIPANKADITIKELEEFTTTIAEGRQTAEERAEEIKREEVAKKQIKETEDAISASLGPEVVGVMETLEGNAKNELAAFSFNLTASPPPVKIHIGKWLYIKEAVITNAQFSFSDRMTAKGPLFCDVTLTISTRENLMLTVDKNGENTLIPQFQMFNLS